jgi:hypothetical protein
MKREKAEISKADKYLVNGQYRFPFVCMDPTPGGGSLGRIEWRLEPVAKRGKIVKIFLQATQTRDEAYVGKTFELEVEAPSIFGSPRDNDDFLGKVWRTYYCPEHKTFALEAYPKNHHNVLIIERFSGIGIRVEFGFEEQKN